MNVQAPPLHRECRRLDAECRRGLKPPSTRECRRQNEECRKNGFNPPRQRSQPRAWVISGSSVGHIPRCPWPALAAPPTSEPGYGRPPFPSPFASFSSLRRPPRREGIASARAGAAHVAGVLLGKGSGSGPAGVRGGSRNALCLQGVSAAFRIRRSLGCGCGVVAPDRIMLAVERAGLAQAGAAVSKPWP